MARSGIAQNPTDRAGAIDFGWAEASVYRFFFFSQPTSHASKWQTKGESGQQQRKSGFQAEQQRAQAVVTKQSWLHAARFSCRPDVLLPNLQGVAVMLRVQDASSDSRRCPAVNIHRPLRRASRLSLVWNADNSVWLESANGRLHVGASVFPLLDLFYEPLSMHQALQKLAPNDIRQFVSLTSELTKLVRAGALIEASEDPPLAAYEGFEAPQIHLRMLDDRTRTDAFIRALRETVRPGDVVLDIGTGTGILAMAAARMGASKVYAVEAGAAADVASRVIAVNGLEDTVEVVRGSSRLLDLDRKVDVVVSETLGSYPYAEGIVQCLTDARLRLAHENARFIPDEVELLAVPLCLPSWLARRRASARLAA